MIAISPVLPMPTTITNLLSAQILEQMEKNVNLIPTEGGVKIEAPVSLGGQKYIVKGLLWKMSGGKRGLLKATISADGQTRTFRVKKGFWSYAYKEVMGDHAGA